MVTGGTGNDTIYGGTASLGIMGGSGNDTVYGVGTIVDPVTGHVTYSPVAPAPRRHRGDPARRRQ